jgi:hypothetical protein
MSSRCFNVVGVVAWFDALDTEMKPRKLTVTILAAHRLERQFDANRICRSEPAGYS